MVARRAFVEYIALIGAGAGLYAMFGDEVDIPTPTSVDIPDISAPSVGGIGEPPPTETKIGEHTTSDIAANPIEKITFYESGAAEVLFMSDHDFDRFGVTHNDLESPEDHFAAWDAPRFQGPKVVDLKRVIVNNGPYPSNAFAMGPDYDTSEAFYIGDVATFAAPNRWYREAGTTQPES